MSFNIFFQNTNTVKKKKHTSPQSSPQLKKTSADGVIKSDSFERSRSPSLPPTYVYKSARMIEVEKEILTPYSPRVSELKKKFEEIERRIQAQKLSPRPLASRKRSVKFERPSNFSVDSKNASPKICNHDDKIVEKLTEQIQITAKERDEMKQRNEVLAARIKDLEFQLKNGDKLKEVDALKMENELLKSELRDSLQSQIKLNEISTLYDLVIKDIEQLDADLYYANEQLKYAAEELENTKNENITYKQEVKRLKLLLEENKNEDIQKLEEIIKKKDEVINQHIKEKEEYLQKTHELAAEKERIEMEFKEAQERHKKQIEEAEKKLETQKKETKEIINKMTQDAEKISQLCDDLKELNESLKNELQRTKSEMQFVKEGLKNKKDGDVQLLLLELHQLKSIHEQNEKQFNDMQQKLKKEISELNEELTKQREEHKSFILELTNKHLEEMRSLRENAFKEKEELRKQFHDTLQEKIKEAVRKLFNEVTQLKSKLKEYENLEKKENTGTTSIANEDRVKIVEKILKEEIEKKEERIYQLERENEKYKIKLEEMTNLYNKGKITEKELQNSLDRLSEEFDYVKHLLQEEMKSNKGFELQMTKKALSEALDMNKILKEEIDKLKERNNVLQETINVELEKSV